MSSDRSIETTGETVEEAIAKGLAQLGVRPTDVIVEVLEEPARALFGNAPREARVRLQVLSMPSPPPPPPLPPATPATPPPASRPKAEPPPGERVPSAREPRSAARQQLQAERDRAQGKTRPDRERVDAASERSERSTERSERGGRDYSEGSGRRSERSRDRDRDRERDYERVPRADFGMGDLAEYDIPEDEDDSAASLFSDSDEVLSETDMDEEAIVGRVVLNELLERMSVRARIAVRRARANKPEEGTPYILNVTGGGDLTRLIGRRGDTLAALQYITRLITSRELQRRANVIVDVDSYKAKRARMLQGLALRMAAQAVEQGRTVQLEPMPPHERRIIHLALRDRDDVSTKSVGEGAGRKVTIIPVNPTTDEP